MRAWDQALWLYIMLSSGSWYSLVRPPAEPFFRSLIAVQKASGFPLSAMLPTMSAHLAVERLEAKGLVGTARSSPQPPLAVARRARLEVVVPTRQHWTKRLMSSVCVVTDCGACSTAGSIVLFAVHWFGRNIASGVRRRHVPNAVCRYASAEGMTRSPAPVPAGTAVRRGQRRI
jgi:hypothetical protein